MNSLLKRANGQVDSPVSEDEEVEEGKLEDAGDSVPIDEEAEYIDEDRHTTVTIEAVDVTRDGLHKVVDEKDENSVDTRVADIEPSQDLDGKLKQKTKRVWTKERPGGLKKKKKNFRYESKADRKVTRYKEKFGNKAKAKARKE